MKKIYAVIIFIFSSVVAFSQSEGSMFFMRQLPGVSRINPAVSPKYRKYISIPGANLTFSVQNSGFKYSDLVSKGADDSLTITLDKFHGALKDKNYITTGFSDDILGFGFKAGRLYFSYNLTQNVNTRIMFPKSIFTFALQGNASMLGSSVNFAPSLDAIAYLENGLGVSYELNKDFNIGLRIKHLVGIGSVHSQQSDFTISTDAENYSLTVAGGANIQTAGLTLASDSVDDMNYTSLLKNMGAAIDLGLTYRIHDKVYLGLSLVNFGKIGWKEDTRTYFLDKTKNQYTFSGYDFADREGDQMQALEDSVEKNFKFEQKAGEKFSTWVPGKVFASIGWDVQHSLTLGAIGYLEKYKGRLSKGITLSANQEVGRFLGISLSYSIQDDTYNNFGAGFSLKLAPLQFYIVSDNLFGPVVSMATTSYVNDYINNAQTVSFRFGMNLVFGRIKKQEKLSYPNFNPNK